MKSNLLLLLNVLAFSILIPISAFPDSPSAAKIVTDAIDYWRGESSFVEARMTIKRPEWSREMEFRGITKGSDFSLIEFIKPAKDAGNSSLTIKSQNWSYNPKINRVIKIPASMVHQSWMGSDFSYNDLSKGTDIIEYYEHRLVTMEEDSGQKVYVIESIPHDRAPVTWGKEVLKIRADKIILEHDFYDQNMQLVKHLNAFNIKPMGGRLYPETIRMEKSPEEWTEVKHLEVKFGIPLTESDFTTSKLRQHVDARR